MQYIDALVGIGAGAAYCFESIDSRPSFTATPRCICFAAAEGV